VASNTRSKRQKRSDRVRPDAASGLTSPPRRISVVGSTGSGKTTFARELARRLGVPHVELDALAWGPNWKLVPVDVFQERVARAVEGDAWVIDGNYGGRGARDLVWPRADTVVWLDPSLGVIFARLFERAARRIRSGEELWPGTGNRETFRNQFLSRDTLFWWALKTYRRRRRELPLLLARPEHAHLAVHHLRRSEEAKAWLERQPATAGL
jgi:adenylate kinase family enzyme